VNYNKWGMGNGKARAARAKRRETREVKHIAYLLSGYGICFSKLSKKDRQGGVAKGQVTSAN